MNATTTPANQDVPPKPESEATLAAPLGSASPGYFQALEDVRGWLALKIWGGGDCMTTAGDLLDDLKYTAEDPDRWLKAITGL
jgi:hypothetical protein